MSYVITYNGYKLSGFYSNDIRGVFAFRKNDYMIFSTKEEARNKINYIKKEVKDKDNTERWGESLSKSYQNKANKLKIQGR